MSIEFESEEHKRMIKNASDFQMNYEDDGCRCHIAPPCSYCTHPGNPLCLEESGYDEDGNPMKSGLNIVDHSEAMKRRLEAMGPAFIKLCQILDARPEQVAPRSGDRVEFKGITGVGDGEYAITIVSGDADTTPSQWLMDTLTPWQKEHWDRKEAEQHKKQVEQAEDKAASCKPLTIPDLPEPDYFSKHVGGRCGG